MIKRWEYETTRIMAGVEHARCELNAMGSQGWELVDLVGVDMGVVEYIAIFKREIIPCDMVAI